MDPRSLHSHQIHTDTVGSGARVSLTCRRTARTAGRVRLRVAATLVGLMVAGPPAYAAPPPPKVDEIQVAREHFLKGTRAFELGLYNEAITEYIAAYKAKDDPSILFNLGQSYRLAGRREDALRSYKAYLAKSPEASNRDLVQQRMAELQKQLESTKAEPPPVAPAPTPPPPPSLALALTTAAAPAAWAVTISPPRLARRPLFLGGVTLLAVGALALAGGGAAYVLAERAGNQLLWRETNGEAYDPALYSAGQQRALAGTIAFGVGGAALLSGAVLTGLAFRSSRSVDATPRLTLTMHPNLVAAQAAFSF